MEVQLPNPPEELKAWQVAPDVNQTNSAPSPRVSATAGKPRKKKKLIWIDIDNSPHVPFFLPIIGELKKCGVELFLTARDTYQVCELIDYFSMPCRVIGRHYGKSKVLKVLGNCLRAVELLPIAVARRPDLAISHGSRAQVLAAKSLGIPTLVMHDYEHSTKTGFIEPDWILMPAVIPAEAMSRRADRVLKYHGLKEDVYISQFQPDASIFNQLHLDPSNLIVTLRPPATEAHYHNPESDVLFAETVHFLAEQPQVRMVVLPRSVKQNEQIRKEWAELIASGRIVIPSRALNGLNLIWFSDLVISGGGTMNREAAALGVPVYSIFRGKIGAVDKYLSENGKLILIEDAREVRTKIRLAHRVRPDRPCNERGMVLQSIIRNVVSILENDQPARNPTCAPEAIITTNRQYRHVMEGGNASATTCTALQTLINFPRPAIYQFDPLHDSRWDAFLREHARASLFHSSPWLRALKQTYGYAAVGYTTSAPREKLKNAMVFCRVESWLTGRRLVSLPFSDHCEPLVDRQEDLQALVDFLREELKRERWRYVELRPLTPIDALRSLHSASLSYNFFELDLRSDLDSIFRSLHKDSIQRKIRRAQREQLVYEEGIGNSFLNEFYRLLTETRRRHFLPPQPKRWFESLISCFGDALKIRIVRKNGQPLAGMLTLRYKDTLTYKYGASDSRFNNLGGVHLLYWSSIQEAKASGLRFFDLGRTDVDQTGLNIFKKRWGAKESLLTYYRYSVCEDMKHIFESPTSKTRPTAARKALAYMPNSLLSSIGSALYKHVG
jgi:uncharacterized protein